MNDVADKNLNILREIEENERWLAEQPTPAISAAAMARIKDAVQAECMHGRGGTGASRWRPWQGAMVAAAVLALSVGVIRYAAMVSTTSGSVGDGMLLEHVAVVTERESSIDGTTLGELSEGALGETWALSGASMYDAFEAAFDESDDESSGEAGVMGLPNIAIGVIG